MCYILFFMQKYQIFYDLGNYDINLSLSFCQMKNLETKDMMLYFTKKRKPVSVSGGPSFLQHCVCERSSIQHCQCLVYSPWYNFP